MALSAGTAFLDIKPKLSDRFGNELSGAVQSKTGTLGTIGKTAGLAVGGAMVTGIGAAVAGGVASVNAFADLEQGLNEVRTLLPDLPDDAFQGLTDDVQQFAREAGVLPKDVVPALYQALSAGVPPDNVFDFLESANKAALGGVTDLETSVDALTSVTNAYGSDVIDTTEASDLLFTTVRLGKTNFEELGSSLFNVVPTAAGLGVEFGDVTASLAALTAQGTPTSVATTQLRQAFVELGKEGTAVSDTFKEASGKSFRDFIAEGGNLQGALEILKETAAETGTPITDLFGSVEAGNAVLGLTSSSGAELFNNALSEMGESAGATDAAFETMDQGLSRSWDRIKAVTAVTLTEIGERLAPFVEKATDFFAERLPQAIDVLMGVVEALTPIFSTVFGILGDVFGSFSGKAIEGTGQVSGIFGQLGGIISRVSETIRVILGALADFWDEWGGTITTVISTVFGTVVSVISAALDVITGIFDVVLGILTGDWSRAWDGIKTILGGAWDAIKAIVSGAITILLNIIGGFVTNLASSISDGIGNVVELFTGLPGRILGVLSGLPAAMIQLGADLIAGLIAGLGNIGKAVGDKIRGGISSAVSGVKSFFGMRSPSRVIAEELGLPIAQGVAVGAERTGALASKALVSGIDTAAARARQAAAASFPGIASGLLDATASSSVVTGAGGGAGGPAIIVEEGGVVVHNPEPEPASVSVPAELRRLATTLSRS